MSAWTRIRDAGISAGATYLGYQTGGPAGAALAASSVKGYQDDKKNAKSQKKLNQQAREDTRYYFDQAADNTIQRRAADAKKAGISTLASLGAPGMSIPNIQVGQAHKRAGGDNIAQLVLQMMDLNERRRQHDDNMELLRNEHRERIAGKDRHPPAGTTGNSGSNVQTYPLPMSEPFKPTPLKQPPEYRSIGVRPGGGDKQWRHILINDKTYYIRPGTDQETIEGLLGELTAGAIGLVKTWHFTTDNDLLPSKNDLQALLDGFFLKHRQDNPSRRVIHNFILGHKKQTNFRHLSTFKKRTLQNRQRLNQ